MKRTIVCAALAAMIAFPMSALASAPFMGPTDGDDEIPIIVHGPHRGPRIAPAVRVEYNENAGTVVITFNKAATDVRMFVCKNDVGVMDYYIGDTSAGSEYEIPLYDEDTEGMVLYFVSAGEVFSVNSLN